MPCHLTLLVDHLINWLAIKLMFRFNGNEAITFNAFLVVQQAGNYIIHHRSLHRRWFQMAKVKMHEEKLNRIPKATEWLAYFDGRGKREIVHDRQWAVLVVFRNKGDVQRTCSPHDEHHSLAGLRTNSPRPSARSFILGPIEIETAHSEFHNGTWLRRFIHNLHWCSRDAVQIVYNSSVDRRQ